MTSGKAPEPTSAMAETMKASPARDTKGFEVNIGKYVSLAYLEAEAAGF